MIDPQQVAEMLAPTLTATATATAVLPTHTVKPIPTVIPNPTEWQTTSESGFRALWVVFALMVIASATFAGLSWRVPVSRRLYHVVTTVVTITAALSYFAMASGAGRTVRCHRAVDSHDEVPDTWHRVCREVYWVRYADWAVTTPLLLLDLALLAGLDGAHTLMAVLADIVMVLAGLFAALSRGGGGHHGGGHGGAARKWGWFTIAVLAFLVVVWHVAVGGSRTVKAKGDRVVRLFTGLGLFTLLLWIAYPIVWGLADGGRIASVDAEIYSYAVLDVLAKVVFGFWLLLTHRSLPETNVELGGYWTYGLAPEGRIRIGDDEEA